MKYSGNTVKSWVFTGDEMNIHVPQSYEAENELRSLMASQLNIITPQESKPVVGIKQDGLVAAYLMTRRKFQLTKSQFWDITMKGERVDGTMLWNPERVAQIESVLKEYGITTGIFNGRGLISLLLPEDLNYDKQNDIIPEEPVVKVRKGVYISGALDKSILGSAHGSLIQILNKEYGTAIVGNFIDNIQFIGSAWLLVHGFSVGMQDCMSKQNCSTDVDSIVKSTLAQCYAKAQGITETTRNPGIREIRITAALSQARDVGMKVAKDAINPMNNFLVTVLSGAKGDFFNIAQLTAMLGQQNIEGGRIQPCMTHGKRTMPHFHTENLSQEALYQSMGFVTSSFNKGLNPVEYFCHSKSGREGVIDTSMNTAQSGYIQRKIVKTSEDIVVSYDQTVSDTNGRIFQFTYGENQLDSTKTIRVNGVPQICNISHIADRLNTRFEMKLPPIESEEEPSIEFDTFVLDVVRQEKLIAEIKKKLPYSLVDLSWSVKDLLQRLEALEENDEKGQPASEDEEEGDEEEGDNEEGDEEEGDNEEGDDEEGDEEEGDGEEGDEEEPDENEIDEAFSDGYMPEETMFEEIE